MARWEADGGADLQVLGRALPLDLSVALALGLELGFVFGRSLSSALVYDFEVGGDLEVQLRESDVGLASLRGRGRDGADLA